MRFCKQRMSRYNQTSLKLLKWEAKTKNEMEQGWIWCRVNEMQIEGRGVQVCELD